MIISFIGQILYNNRLYFLSTMIELIVANIFKLQFD